MFVLLTARCAMLINYLYDQHLTGEFPAARLPWGVCGEETQVKIFAYRVVQKGPRTFDNVIERLHRLELQDRHFGGSKIRLEDRARRGGILLADFARERGGHGPGRMAPNEALQDIPLRGGQNFGEDTGMAYDLATGNAAIQYNHYGPRSQSIENYLYAYDLHLGGLRAAANPQEPDEERCGV
jgi:hypothetical protein